MDSLVEHAVYVISVDTDIILLLRDLKILRRGLASTDLVNAAVGLVVVRELHLTCQV